MKAAVRALRRRVRCAWRPRTLVLAYHHVCAPGRTAPWVTVSPEDFTDQMAFLAESGLAIGLDEWLAELRRGRLPRGGRVLVTLDDAGRDTARIACPILRRCGVPATLFIPTGLVGRPRAFWWDQLYQLAQAASARGLDLAAFLENGGVQPLLRRTDLPSVRREDGWQIRPPERRADGLWRSLRLLDDGRRDELLAAAADWLGTAPASADEGPMGIEELAALDRDGPFTFGAHTVHHPVLAGLPHDCLTAEVEGARDALAGFRSFRKVFAYPYGDEPAVDGPAVEAVRAAGFEAAFTTCETALSGIEGRLTLGRACIDALPLDAFRGMVDHFLTR
jgi:peptidoglycan/xylan/chitin deacetylase (PgdA/CDA1 family)